MKGNFFKGLTNKQTKHLAALSTERNKKKKIEGQFNDSELAEIVPGFVSIVHWKS